jgi:hypothetical protein
VTGFADSGPRRRSCPSATHEVESLDGIEVDVSQGVRKCPGGRDSEALNRVGKDFVAFDR